MRLAEIILRYRIPIVVGAALAWLGSAWVNTGIEFNFSFWTLFGAEDPEVVRQIEYTDAWGEDAAMMFVVLRARSGDVLTPEGLAAVERIESRAAEVEGIEEVSSILSVDTVRGEGDGLVVGPMVSAAPETAEEAAAFREVLLADPLLTGALVSANGRTTLLALRILPELKDAGDRNPVVTAVEEIAIEETAGTDLEASVAGIPTAQRVYSQTLQTDLVMFVALSCLLMALCLGVMFRTPAAVLLPIAVVIAAASWIMATMVLTGQQVNMLSVALPTLMLVIGIADGVHLLAYYFQRRVAGESADPAVRQTFVKLGWACVLTSVTTSIGFASLAAARLETVRNFGLLAAAGIGFAFVANILLIPIGLSWLRPEPPAIARRRGDTRLVRALERIGRATARHPWRTLALSLPVIALVAAGGRFVQVESRMFEELGDDDPVVLTHRRLEQDLPGVSSYALDVLTEPGRADDPDVLAHLDEMARTAEAHPAIGRAVGLSTVLRQMNRAMHGGDPEYATVPEDPALIAQYLMLAEGGLTERLINEDRSRTHVWMRGPETVTSVWEQLRARLEAMAARAPAGVRVLVTGSSSMGKRALGLIVGDILRSLVGATAVIFVLMALLFRSLRIGLLSMIPNLIPLAITVGVMGYAGITLRTSTVIIFSVSLGLAVDDTIHFLVRFRRERAAGLPLEEAVVETMRGAGRPIVYTSLLLIGGFWILILSSFNAIRDVGLLGGVTLVSALLADLIVLPALLAAGRGVMSPHLTFKTQQEQ